MAEPILADTVTPWLEYRQAGRFLIRRGRLTHLKCPQCDFAIDLPAPPKGQKQNRIKALVNEKRNAMRDHMDSEHREWLAAWDISHSYSP